MQPMWCYAGNPVDLDDTDWRITPVDTNAKILLILKLFTLLPQARQFIEQSEAFRVPMRLGGSSQVTRRKNVNFCQNDV